MSRIVLRIAQIVGVLVLAGLAIGLVVGLLKSLIGIVVIVAVIAGGWWVYKKVSGRDEKPAVGAAPTALPAGVAPSVDRRTELESKAVLDASGRCGWCGSTTLHKDQFGFPVTPLTYHRAEIDAML